MKKRSDSMNRLIYTLVLLGIFILIGIGAFIVNAYGTSTPVVFGHSAGEIDGVCRTDGTGCPSLSSIPAGAVMAFDLSACPEGWTELVSARGRTIVGLNPADSSFDTQGEIGGEKTHTLTIAEMPSHNHGLYSGSSSWDTTWGLAHANPSNYVLSLAVMYNYPSQYGSLDYYTTVTSTGQVLMEETGGNQPHNNLQPYIAFIYCKKN